MKNTELYLKPCAFIEPLINQWYAWSYIGSPATAAMYLVNSQMKIMQSFVTAPQVHIAAMDNPMNLGGPFISYDITKVGAIKDLIQQITQNQAHMLELASALKTLDKKLKDEAKGYSLEPLYKEIPEILKGYVELVYDLNNQPSIRLIEGLLYKSKYYSQTAQSITLSLAKNDERPFVFSTPRLIEDSLIHLNIPFKHEGIDELFKMWSTPQRLEYIQEYLGIEAKDTENFGELFTESAPEKSSKYQGEDVRIRYFGHACILIETNNTSILFDPVVSYPHGQGIDRFTYADLPPEIDYVILTHNHQDHVVLEPLIQLRHRVKTLIVPKNNGGSLADPSLKLLMQSIGFKNVRELDEMETIETQDGFIMGLPFFGEHTDLNIRSKLCYWVRAKSKSILCLIDTKNIDDSLYGRVYDVVGDVDVQFIGMECDGSPMTWVYGPLLTRPLPRDMDQSRRYDCSNHEMAMGIVNRFNPKQVYIYAMGQEPWLTFLTSKIYAPNSYPILESDKVVADCHLRGIEAERMFGKKEIYLKVEE